MFSCALREVFNHLFQLGLEKDHLRLRQLQTLRRECWQLFDQSYASGRFVEDKNGIELLVSKVLRINVDIFWLKSGPT